MKTIKQGQIDIVMKHDSAAEILRFGKLSFNKGKERRTIHFLFFKSLERRVKARNLSRRKIEKIHQGQQKEGINHQVSLARYNQDPLLLLFGNTVESDFEEYNISGYPCVFLYSLRLSLKYSYTHKYNISNCSLGILRTIYHRINKNTSVDGLMC